ncbi:hypothetical protein PR202_gb28207 [Eleusine coracana subsp. coracana]|uniref:non-specific serine/threonine protein kinase n=1 Tax=Eleusine coracana subsp. coracana TaxID=191504 RepID=A0AAV5FWP4_ELECO|nr:hypothetical protein PR202_gb28207 [Eleusine coracana subsp. coracana]
MSCFSHLFKGKRRPQQQGDPSNGDFSGAENITAENITNYSYRELVRATTNFANKIGEGGYGPVFKGFLKDGTAIAVKVLSLHSRQGAKEFLNELLAISDVTHENLVKLYGCCIEGSHRILVYNYLENNSLAHTLLVICFADRGYLAPEYAIRGQVTRKADVYSYGVLLMEIVSGRCNTDTKLPYDDQILLEKV